MTSLNLSFNNLSDERIIEGLAESVSLTHLDLSHNNFSSLPPLRRSHVSHSPNACNTDVKECCFITLTSLDISHNKINFKDMSIFEHNPCLRILNLSHNKSTFEFTSTLTSNSSLTVLDLSYNGIIKFSEPLFQKNNTLKDLNLEGNQISNIQRISQVLNFNKAITALNINHQTPPISSKILENINAALEKNKSGS